MNSAEPTPHITPTPVLTPTPEQLAWQKAGLGMFFHVGINTFAGKEWSDGTVPAAAFDPSDLDADEWVRAAADLGARYVVLTAKHHDGFCLWPTGTTDYSVASSPWKDGQGDVVGEVADACRRHGLGLGLYLSPWDRHEPCYGDPEAYDAFYLRQLRELCTRYGELFELWFDGAGSSGRTYDWEAIGALIGELQPQAMVFNMGPATIRWVGNEDGLAEDPCEYVTRSTDLNQYDPDVIALGGARYLPPECDVSLHDGWFWQEGEKPKSLEHLLAIHDRSLGLGANLLLNVPPNRQGRIDRADLERLGELRLALDARFGSPIEAPVTSGEEGFGAALPEGTRLDHLELEEDVLHGQRVRSHRILDGKGRVLAEGGTIGVRRIHRLERPVTLPAGGLRVEIAGDGAVLAAVRAHDAGDAPVPSLDGARRASTETPG